MIAGGSSAHYLTDRVSRRRPIKFTCGNVAYYVAGSRGKFVSLWYVDMEQWLCRRMSVFVIDLMNELWQ